MANEVSPSNPETARAAEPAHSAQITEAITKPRSGGRIEGLDGLRAFAVLSVLFYHFWPKALPGGFLGVDVFFVISGFLITTLLLRESRKYGHINLKAFWIRRARRLLPALFLVVISSVAVAWLVSEDLLVNIQRQVIGAITFSTNWIEIWAGSDYFADSGHALFLTFWSLAVEEQFYIFWPLLFIAFLKVIPSRAVRSVVAILLAAASVGLMVWIYDPAGSPTRVYYGTDTHSFGLMIGVAMSFAFDGGPILTENRFWQALRPVIGFAAFIGLTLLVIFIDNAKASTYPGGLLAASLLSAAAVATLPGKDNIFIEVCRLRPLAWVGERSYGIYLWHWPVLLIIGAAVTKPGENVELGLPLILLIAALTFGLSEASYRWIEGPIREEGFIAVWKNIVTRFKLGQRIFQPIAAAGGTILLIVLAGIGFLRAPEKSKAQLAVEEGEKAIAEQNAANSIPATGPVDPALESPAWPVDMPIPTGDYMVGFGDSVMSGAAPALYQRFPGIHINAKPILQWRDAPAMVKAMIDKGTMRRVVVLNFGTNAGFKEPESEAALREILTMLGPKRRVVLINNVGVSYWIPSTNERLNQISAEFPNTIVADWYSIIKDKPNLLHRDKTHPNDEGCVVYANMIAASMEKLGRG